MKGRRPIELSDDFDQTRANLKQELLEAGIKRPDQRLIRTCLVTALVVAPVGIILELVGYRKAASGLILLMALLFLLTYVAQRSPWLKIAVRKTKVSAKRDCVQEGVDYDCITDVKS